MYTYSEAFKEAIEKAIKDEVDAGIRKWGAVNSTMEAFAILKGELTELMAEVVKALDKHEYEMWPLVHKNSNEDAGKIVAEIRCHMLYTIFEAIQAAGVCDSFLAYFCKTIKK